MESVYPNGKGGVVNKILLRAAKKGWGGRGDGDVL